MGYVVWDTETTIAAQGKRKASPFSGENWVVAQGWKKEGGQVQHEYFGKRRPPAGWGIKLLDKCSVLVGMNIKFDLLHMMQDSFNRKQWMKYVADGGMIWDIQLAEYLLNGQKQEDFYLSLNDLAGRYGGTQKIDAVKELWNAGVCTQDIDRGLLLDYLCGTGPDDLGDIGNTEKVYLGQLAKAKESGQLKSILLNMGSLIASTEMEFNGLFVDTLLAEQLRAEVAAELAEVSARLDSYIPKDLPFEFKWTSRHHKSALIFGGRVKYQARVTVLDDIGSPIYCMKDEEQYLLTDGSLVSAKAMALPENQAMAVRYKSGKNAGEFKTRRVKVPDRSKPKTRMEDIYYALPGYTEPDPKWESADKGVYSVSSEVIEALGERDIPFLKDLAAMSKLSKDLGTYYWAEDKDGNRKGMLTHVFDNIIHHSINHSSTVTGRFSSSDPNLQNVPKGKKSQIKRVFRSRFGEEGVIIQSDFSNLEVYVQANLTKCARLIRELLDGVDMHCMRLATKEGMSYEEVYKLCKIDEDPEWDYKRTLAKVFSFQRAYGAGAQKIADSTGMPLADVEALIAAEEIAYPEIGAYFKARAEEIQRSRVPTRQFVSHPEIRGLQVQLGRGHCFTPDGKMYTYMESPSPAAMARRGHHASFSPTIIQNYEVQGTGAEFMKAAMWLAVRGFYATENFKGLALLINTVHDAQYADAHKDAKAAAAAMVHASMELASPFMEQWFGWELGVPVPSDTMAGPSMMDEDHIDFSKYLPAVKTRLAARCGITL